MRNVRLGELVLGVEGVALMRHLLRGTDEQIASRVAEIVKFSSELEAEPLSLGLPLPEVGVPEGYGAWAETYDRPGNPLIYLEEPVMREILGALPAGTALDAACGTGRHTELLSRAGHTVVGVDATLEMLERARAKVPTATFLQGDLESLPVDDETMDLAVCSLALTHLERVAVAIEELARVVRPDGTIILSDMHPAAALLLGGAAVFPDKDGNLARVRDHLHLISEYVQAFIDTGLKIVDCREVLNTLETAKMQAFSYPIAPQATAEALVGIPFALIWRLEKAA